MEECCVKIGVLDADLMDNGTRHPNLALMKIAGYYRDQGNEVTLIYGSYDEINQYERVFVSKVFTFSEIPQWVLESKHVSFGGTGFFEDGGENLPEEIEHHMPYYDIYKEYVEHQIASGKKASNYSDYMEYSIGFTSRGCFRKCDFCVNKKYSHAFRHSPISEFLDESRPYIYLWDDNILALPEWENVLDEIEATKKPFQFRQGIDLRLMTEDKAKRFVNSHYQGDFIFAFDHIEDTEKIVKKVQLWKRYERKICKMYVICAYKSQDEHDIADVFERIHILMKYGSLPYVMRYEAYKESKYKSIYIELARWCNQPGFFKKKSFRQFCVANQDYKKNKETNCSAYQAMLDFERDFPDIAEKYFDLRFEEENMYAVQYGYGRKYVNKPCCEDCQKAGVCWSAFVNNEVEADKILEAYLTKELDLECLNYTNAQCEIAPEIVATKLVQVLLEASGKHMISVLRKSERREPVTQDNIPQFSDREYGLQTVEILRKLGEEVGFDDLGHYLKRGLLEAKLNTVANKKFGKNHAKFAAQLDLVKIDKVGLKSRVRESVLGSYFSGLPKEMQELLVPKLCLRIPIIQNYFVNFQKEDELNQEVLSASTKKRRGSNVKNVIELVQTMVQD